MNYAELSTVFTDSYGYQDVQQHQQEEIPVQVKVITCEDYDDHIDNCARCMFYQTRKRTNLLNIIIIFTLIWMILRR